MNCKTCDYALWNLRTRVCPECGSSFNVADFEWRPGAVRFCCPHCNQAYYGTDAKGHLVPPEFECIACGQSITMEEMVLLPAEGVRSEDTAPRSVPWTLRRSLGVVSAWFGTIGWGFAGGTKIGRSLQGVAAPMPALAFAAVTMLIVAVGSNLPMLCLMAPGLFAGGGGAGMGMGAMGWFAILQAGASLVAYFAILGTVILLSHGVLSACGGATRTLGATVEVICYTCGPLVIMLIPCLGGCISPFAITWWLVCAGMALAARHKAAPWQATLAMVLSGLPAMVIGFVLGWMLLVYSFVGVPMPGAALATGQAGAGVGSMAMAWRIEMASPSIRTPLHAAQFLDSGFVQPSSFLTAGTTLTLADVPVGSLTLADFSDTSGARLADAQRAALAEAAASLPANIIAHRVGDMVFTYHGINPATAAQELWVVIASPLPANTIGLPAIVVGKVGGGTESFTSDAFPAALASQNALRARFGLAPLPGPEKVTHDQPAVAGDQ